MSLSIICDDPGNRSDERKQMIEEQLILRGINNRDILQSMLIVPRHCFVSKQYQAYAYDDCPLPISAGQTISQPYIVALMVKALKPANTDRVLEIGTGSGYAAAVLSRIVAMVYTIERHEALGNEAQARLKALKYDNIQVRIGDGTKGWYEKSPFDGIIVSAGAPNIPQSLVDQLKPGGHIVVPVGDEITQELLILYKKHDGETSIEKIGAVRFVPLIGDEGWDMS
ncbi:MAG: protein-L-isoaspartate(D-aspartate) O-methyltransferase [Desulfotomaculaceae bacterium]|nr:protein-L-isoaspartate(D-aspartate) O-methyltransferase [Desulfotomaculaceae bacterium]